MTTKADSTVIEAAEADAKAEAEAKAKAEAEAKAEADAKAKADAEAEAKAAQSAKDAAETAAAVDASNEFSDLLASDNTVEAIVSKIFGTMMKGCLTKKARDIDTLRATNVALRQSLPSIVAALQRRQAIVDTALSRLCHVPTTKATNVGMIGFASNIAPSKKELTARYTGVKFIAS